MTEQMTDEPTDELTPRGVHVCRGCGADGLVSVLDLGRQPLSNEMALTTDEPSPTFPLHLRVCPTCGLGQIGEYVLPDRIFGAEYPYLSSVSTSWLAHAGEYTRHMIDELGLGEGDLVMEVASNDGYLLTQMLDAGMRVVGIEPAGKVAEIARSRGVETVNDFFGLAVAEQVAEAYGRPRLIAANNVMAHVPDLQDFLAGMSHLCDDDTVVTVENPSFVTQMLETQFDTIYHEHFCYLSAHAVAAATAGVGLELTRVEKLTTHGGSNRYWLTRTGTREAHPSVAETIAEELEDGLLTQELWDDFAARSRAVIQGLRTWLDDQHAAGRTVAGYGAAAKGNTLMNAAGVRHDDLVLVVDGSEAKQGKFLPGSHVPVAAPTDLAAAAPDDVLVLPWNIAPEIGRLVGELVPGATTWIAVPEMRKIG